MAKKQASKQHPLDIPKARAALLRYYLTHRRDLPWRQTRDPYRIWVSEIMLQQTQVDTVVPRYGPFLKRFPTLKALASASEEAVCEAWAGLGYYRRARNLHRGAVQVMTELAGKMPQNAEGLQKITGIGRYTAGAIASIAFGEEAPILDGNVIRVLSRLYAFDGDTTRAAGQKTLWGWAQAWAQGPNPGDLNQGLMELGATVCTRTSPACGKCPITSHCQARAQGNPETYPTKKTRKAPTRLDIAFVLWRQQGKTMLWQRPVEGLWAGLWEPPNVHGRGGKKELEGMLGVSLGRRQALVSHQLTHRSVRASVYIIDGSSMGEKALAELPRPLRGFAKPLEAPISTLARKVLSAV